MDSQLAVLMADDPLRPLLTGDIQEGQEDMERESLCLKSQVTSQPYPVQALNSLVQVVHAQTGEENHCLYQSRHFLSSGRATLSRHPLCFWGKGTININMSSPFV